MCILLDFLLFAMLYSAPHMVRSPCYFPTAITLYTDSVSSLAMHQLNYLFKIYSSMYNTTIVVCKISAQSKLEKILSTFYYQFFWPLEPLGTGCDVMTSVAYEAQVQLPKYCYSIIYSSDRRKVYTYSWESSQI